MKNYAKLVHFEINRFFKLYVVLMGVTILFQLIGAVVVANDFMNRADQIMLENQLTVNQFIVNYGVFSFWDFLNSGWFIFPIMFCIAMLLIYVFFIWYRDWFGKNTFIYRLLMLPTERISIYFAKLTSIMLLVFGLIALQIILVTIEKLIVNGIIPENLRESFSYYGNYYFDIWNLLYPNSFMQFIIHYGVGLTFVAVAFTAILFERSFRFKGIFFAIAYGLLSFGVFITPSIVDGYITNRFYPNELFLMNLGTCLLVFGSAIWIANYLLKHKIRV